MKFGNFIVLVLLMIFVSACQQNKSQSSDSKIVKDYFNRSIKIPQKIRRIIPVYYVQAEIICAIGAKDKIVGIGKIDERSSAFIRDYFPELLKLPQISQNSINYEKIISLHPDIIFTGTEKSTNERFEQLGCIAIATYPKNLKDVTDEIVFYGSVLGKDKEAQKISSLFNDITNKIKVVSNNIPMNKRPKVYYMRSDALTSLGGKMQGEIISLAGGNLVTNGIGDNATSLQMSFEDIYKYNPDVIILRDRASLKPNDIYNDERWKDINAVKNKRVFQEHYGWTEFRLETIFGIIEKAKWLHPELFKDLSAETEYKKFIEIVNQNN